MHVVAIAVFCLTLRSNCLQTSAYASTSAEDVELPGDSAETRTALGTAGDCNCSAVYTCDDSRNDSDVSDPPCRASDGDDDPKASGETSMWQRKDALAHTGVGTKTWPLMERNKRSPEEATEAPATTRKPPRVLFVRLWPRWPFRRVLVVPVKVANYTLIRVGK